MGRRWWPAVYVGDIPTEWWLIAADGRLIRAVPYVPGVMPR